jgi:hypothetical protein
MTTEKEVRIQQIEVRKGKIRRQMEANAQSIVQATHNGKESPLNLLNENYALGEELRLLEAERVALGGAKLVVK